MADSYVMKVSKNGQVSIPAAARTRWQAGEVLVVDLGDRVVIRPQPSDPLDEIVGKYAGRGPSSERARRTTRQDEDRRARSHR